MADYDASVRVKISVDNSELEKTEKSVGKAGETAGKAAERTGRAAEKAADTARQKIKQQEGDWNSLIHVAQEFETRLKDLTNKGFGPGDAIFDECYIGWKNADDALKKYLSDLDKQTTAGAEKEAEKAAREVEKWLAAQEKAAKEAEKQEQIEAARAAKEAEKAAKLEAEAAKQKELADIKASAIVHDRDMVALLQEQESITERMALLKKAGAGEGYEEYDALATRLQDVNAVIARQRNGFEKAEKSGKKFFNMLKKDSRQSVGILGTLAKKISALALAALVFNQIRKGFNAMISAAKEGFKNLAQYSSDYNRQMSALQSSLAQTKNALAAAFEPVANIIIPYLNRMVNWLNIAIDAVGQFLAALSGSSTYTRAKKQTIDYAKSLDAATKAAKGALASFDELNVLNDDSGASGSAGGEATGADAFETAEIDSKILEGLEAIEAIVGPFIDRIASWWNELNFEPLLTSLENLKTACEPFLGYVYDGLLFFLDEILLPIGSWTIEEGLPAFLDLLASGFEFLSTTIDTLKPGLSYIWENVLKPMGEYTGEAFIGAIDLIEQAVTGLTELLSSKSDEIDTILMGLGKAAEILWTMAIKPTLDFIMGAASELVGYIINIVGDIIDILAGIITFIEGMFTGDLEKALGDDGLLKVVKGIVNGIIDLFEGVVNSIIEGLNKLSFDVPDWVIGIGGQHFGFDLEKLKLPRLAQGAVIQGGKPFAAILGDQRVGQTNIETPLQTMVDAFKQALAETGGIGGGSFTFIAQLDGNEIFKETIRRDQIFYDTTGHGAYEH